VTAAFIAVSAVLGGALAYIRQLRRIRRLDVRLIGVLSSEVVEVEGAVDELRHQLAVARCGDARLLEDLRDAVAELDPPPDWDMVALLDGDARQARAFAYDVEDWLESKAER